MTKIALLPCPFCGGTADLVHETFDFGPWHVCFCVGCGVMTPAGESKEAAAKIWNTRIANSDLKEENNGNLV